MIVVALDTATEILSVSIAEPGEWSHTLVSDRGLRHTGKLMSFVDTLLAQTETAFESVELIACSRGPGSFTGLRIGMATAKGLAEAVAARRRLAQPPVVSLPTLSAMASALPPTGRVLAVIDGRKGRYYAAVAVAGQMVGEPVDLAAPLAVPALLEASGTDAGDLGSGSRETVVVTGPHAVRFVEEWSRCPESEQLPWIRLQADPGARRGWARYLAELAPAWLEREGPDARDAGPLYLRVSDAEMGITRT